MPAMIRFLRGTAHLIGWAHLLLLLGCRQPPSALLQHARSALDSAVAAGALRYAEPAYRRAEGTLKRGWMEMARQNGRFGPFRDYAFADSLLKRALELADSAETISQQIQERQSTRAQEEIASLQEELISWRDALNGALALYSAERLWKKADLDLQTSRKLFRDAETLEAYETASRGRKALKEVGQILAEQAFDEKRQMANWRRWVQETIAESKSNGYALIVNKAVHRTYLLKDGDLLHTYKCELGYNSARQKLFSGDGATPEGKYRITSIRNNGSKYYKSLMLDYPNATDRKRFEDNKRRGIISRKTHIGANIAIHGGAGRRKDWTDGCVALQNEDIDELMKFVSAGTPVTIVRRSDQWP